ncbi:conserved unknown protein [Ectocarpus siliculosus]|uniref:Chloride channel protein n=1 Tax=Ectocarpus siliculosus TaxID=2880 RepID=D8LJI7_ECTSI|nr:conserved unknown protein [Ectocarpus siliculosus]|eukprot:CBN77014.1 conserved unknown protein [Ectocarpus siliculosus]
MFVVVALATLLVIPASFTEDVAFSVDRAGRAKYHPLIDSIYDQTQFGMSWRLISLLLIKFWTTIFSVVQPLPVGLFSPIFVIGGLMGRIFGEIANWVDHCLDSVNINFQPWEFALIGSAAFSAGVTRAVSTAVIVFELSGENHLRLPLGVALMISYFIANRFTKGVYDALMDTNKTPHLEEDLMIKAEEIPCPSLECTWRDSSEEALRYLPGQFKPVGESMSDKVLVGVVLWNDLAIALADYRRRGSSITAISSTTTAPASINSSRGAPLPAFASTTTMIDGRRFQVVGGGDSAAAATAAAAGGRFEWEESSEEGGGEGDSGGGSWWPRLAEVGGAIGRRIGWFPMVRTAEASLLRELAGKREDGGGDDDDAGSLSPLGEGIPLGGGTAAAAVGTDSAATTTTTTTTSNSSAGRRTRSSRKALSPAPPVPVPVAGIEKAKRAPIRFYLVREGHRFVPVGRNPKKGAWKELPEVAIPAARESIPVVLDPSPYQVSHTTELSKVDIAFRLLRLDNAYVCNAGRLVGVITREALADFVDDREVSPMDDCVRLCGALACCLPGRAPADDNAGGSGLRRRISRRSISRGKLAASAVVGELPPGRGGADLGFATSGQPLLGGGGGLNSRGYSSLGDNTEGGGEEGREGDGGRGGASSPRRGLVVLWV